MANDYRKQIRDATKAAIQTAALGFSEVSIGRRNRVPKKNLPACCIYTDGEEIEVITIKPRRLNRRPNLVIRIFIKQKSTIADDVLDTFAYQIEDTLAESDNLGISFVKNIIPASWEVEGEEDDADDKYLAGTLTFTCEYETVESE